MKKSILMAIGLGLLFIGQTGVMHADILTSDVSLKYLNESNVLETTNADFAFGGLHKPSITSDLTVTGQSDPYNGTYDYILKLDTSETLYVTSEWFSYSDNLDFRIKDLPPNSTVGGFVVEWRGSSIPTYFDFVFGFGIGTTGVDPNIAYYGFDEIYLSALQKTADGTYRMAITNKPGNIAGLSHLIVYGKQGSTTPVPEPATMLLFGTGLAGLAAVARRRKN